jgi:hypothetical protein
MEAIIIVLIILIIIFWKEIFEIILSILAYFFIFALFIGFINILSSSNVNFSYILLIIIFLVSIVLLANFFVNYKSFFGKDKSQQNFNKSLPINDKEDQFDLEILSMLLENGLDINVKDENGQTALHKLVKANSPKLVKEFLNRGANPLIKDNKGNIPLNYAKSKEIISILKHSKQMKKDRYFTLLIVLSLFFLPIVIIIVISIFSKGY